MPRGRIAGDPLARILGRTTITAAGCWEWDGYRERDGYGRAMWNGRLWLTHRMTYTLMVGPIPDGLTLDHLCRNRPCCNPEHLEPVTQAVNNSRSSQAHGEVLVAIARAKTQCPHGHPYDEANTYRQRATERSRGGRSCKTCRAQYSRRQPKRGETP